MVDLAYFAQHGKMTNPGPYEDLYTDLPTDLTSLVQVVQGLTVHVFWTECYGLTVSEEQRAEIRWNSSLGTVGAPSSRIMSLFHPMTC